MPEYTLTTPTFDKVTITLNPDFYSQKELVIEVANKESDSDYIKRVEMGGKKCGFRINHNDLMEAGKLTFYKK